jgi:hypothetical protein
MTSRARRSAAFLSGAGVAMAGMLAGACTAPPARATAMDVEATQRLVGVWDVTFTAEPTAAMSADVPPLQERGSFAFVAAGGRATNRLIGVGDTEIRPHYLARRDAGVPLTGEVHRVSRHVRREASWTDSLYILVDEGGSGFLVRLAGTMAGDSASGSWSANSHSSAGGGRFTMRRHGV